jgi:thiol-disulfide isomerase/thioredoxin
MSLKFGILFSTVVVATFGISGSFSVPKLIQRRLNNAVVLNFNVRSINNPKTSRTICNEMSLRLAEGNAGVVDEVDEDFLAMTKEIDALIAGTPASSAEQTKSPETVDMDAGGSTGLRKWIATASAIMGGLLFFFQHTQPVSSVALLKAMERDSMDFSVALCNGKPTLVEFYADWCESCKAMAPTMRSIETQYKDRINFITIDGSSFKNGMF